MELFEDSEPVDAFVCRQKNPPCECWLRWDGRRGEGGRGGECVDGWRPIDLANVCDVHFSSTDMDDDTPTHPYNN
jgi:hypothetical protein